jgi:hypothetical protein
VKSYVITLSSSQELGNPQLLNHYLFVDPVYRLNFVYGLTADGGAIYPNTFVETVSGGQFFPWGYIFQTTYEFITAAPFKGPYNITFSPSGIDTSSYAALKIAYDFGDGESIVIERDIVPNLVGAALLNSGDPTSVNISHEYWPKSNEVTTYIPTITVLNGNMSANIFRYKLDFYPSTIYDFEDIRLLNIAQHAENLDETLGVFEIDKPENYTTNARFFSAADRVYNNVLPDVNFDIVYSDSVIISGVYQGRSNLILNLDASDPLVVFKDLNNLVSYWKDKSVYGNDFAQGVFISRPLFLYETQSQSQRKCILFNGLTTNKFLTCINSTGFATITSDYTLFLIMKGNIPDGTIFYSSSSLPPELLLNNEVSHILLYDRALTPPEKYEIFEKLSIKWGVNFEIPVDND